MDENHCSAWRKRMLLMALAAASREQILPTLQMFKGVQTLC
jgi:hypothetical protein